jgi:primosomal protein N''
MSCSRYFDRWSKLGKQDNRVSPEQNLNIYNEYKMLYDITIDSLEAIQQSIEQLKEQKDYKGIRENSFLAEKLTCRCQALLQTMSDSLSKVYTYSNLNRIVQITLDIIKEQDAECYAKAISKIKENVELAELMKQIKETKV